MARLWVLLTWLVMAALPVQGFAAASMLFCAAATHDANVESTQAVTSSQHARTGHIDAADSAAKQAQGFDISDAAHQCGLCASCCHSVAITEVPSIVALTTAPRAEMADPFAPMPSRASPVPDKPPRA
jgi:hypothetical protein